MIIIFLLILDVLRFYNDSDRMFAIFLYDSQEYIGKYCSKDRNELRIS